MIHRRGLITGLISLVAAPAIVRVSSLMPVKVMQPLPDAWIDPLDVWMNPGMVPGSAIYFSDEFNGHAAGTPFYVTESKGNSVRIQLDRLERRGW